ncbi:DUF421 domain-containing protein [Tuberibacillus sp. Marseille-P3662]|uniref:DUF421 domain-containing protein n=1 Tax=Tuberibacillus sp. Marseille-P3662 TaxID=1965358 RepID=UPI000A1CDFD4|nr:DUF421 domain-containing protein [Tuberibacillus sp. Marseille-P3662]
MPEPYVILVRSLIAFIVVLTFARLMGKKQISQLTFFDYIVGITIGSITATLAINQNIRIIYGLIGLFVWGILPILFGWLSIRSNIFRKLVEGSPTKLIENGQVLERNLHQAKMSVDDLTTMLREKNAFNLSDVELAVLETNGKVSVMKKANQQPLTPKDMDQTVEDSHEPKILVVDGHLLQENLHQLGYTKEWLLGELQKQGANDFSNVFLAQIDSKGRVYADLYHDRLKIPKVQQRALVSAQLKKVQADLETFAQQTNNEGAKQMYSDQAQQLKQTTETLKPYLK